MSAPAAAVLDIPDFSLVVLIGPNGAGKSTFAARSFAESEIVSTEACEAMVGDLENGPTVAADGLELARQIAEKRLKNRRLTVIDSTNVRPADRRTWIDMARRWHALPVAIVLDPGLKVCVQRNKARPERNVGEIALQRMEKDLQKNLRRLKPEGFRQIWTLSTSEGIEAAKIERRALWTDKRLETGPFDIVGDVHGCADELRQLLGQLGYVVSGEGAAVSVASPAGRKLVFVGDLVDRGPNSPEALRIVMAAKAAGVAFIVQGNHDRRAARWMEGRDVQVSHGLQETINQMTGESQEFRAAAKSFLSDLRSYYWLDGGKLAIAQAASRKT